MIDVEWFPFDVQICYITFLSMSYDLNEVQLKFSKDANSSFSRGYGNEKTSESWEILNVVAKLDAVSNIYENNTYFQGFNHI